MRQLTDAELAASQAQNAKRDVAEAVRLPAFPKFCTAEHGVSVKPGQRFDERLFQAMAANARYLGQVRACAEWYETQRAARAAIADDLTAGKK